MSIELARLVNATEVNGPDGQKMVIPFWLAAEIERLQRCERALAKAEEALGKVESMTVPAGYDSGHAGVARVSRQALDAIAAEKAGTA